MALKEVYENIMSAQGKPSKSRSYRFKAHNGCFITLETIWSCFINPWSKKLEFVDGKHTIFKGPVKKDVFSDPGDDAEADGKIESTPVLSAGPEVLDPNQV